jgi:hypothetical protein
MTEREKILATLNRKWNVLLEMADYPATVAILEEDIKTLERKLDAIDNADNWYRVGLERLSH